MISFAMSYVGYHLNYHHNEYEILGIYSPLLRPQSILHAAPGPAGKALGAPRSALLQQLQSTRLRILERRAQVWKDDSYDTGWWQRGATPPPGVEEGTIPPKVCEIL